MFQKAELLADKLLATQTKEVLLHGDLHHENVKLNSRGEYVCYDPKGFIGDPAYELGTTLKNPWKYPNIAHDKEMFIKRAKYFSNELNLPFDRVIGFAYVHFCLSFGWALEDGGDYSHQFELIRQIGNLVKV